MTEADDNLARSLFTDGGKKTPAQRKKPAAKAVAASESPAETAPEGVTVPTDSPEWQRLQYLAQAWEEKYQQAQQQLDQLQPLVIQLQTQVATQAKDIQEQRAAIEFWQQKANTPAPVPPTTALAPQQPIRFAIPEQLPDFMLD